MRFQNSASLSYEAIRELSGFFGVHPEDILIRRMCIELVERYPFKENIHLRDLTISFIKEADLDTIKEVFSITSDMDFNNYNATIYKASINFSFFNE